jgi:hypothetical protein
MKIRTDRETSRLDISYIGTFIGGEFTPSAEVSEAKFFRFEDLPLLPYHQLHFISLAIDAKKST